MILSNNKKLLVTLLVFGLLFCVVTAESLLLKKKHSSKSKDSEEDMLYTRHDPFNKALVLQKIDQMECRKLNNHDYEVNLQEILGNIKYYMGPTLLDFYRYVQCDLQKFRFWQCVDQAINAAKGWTPLPQDIIYSKYQDFGGRIDQQCRCKFTYKDFYLKNILNDRVKSEKVPDLKALAKFYSDSLEDSKAKWEGVVTDYQTCVKDILDSISVSPMEFPSPFTKVNAEVVALKCNANIVPEDIEKDNSFKNFAKNQIEAKTLLSYLKQKNLVEGNQYFTCLQEAIMRVYPPRPEKFVKDAFKFLDDKLEVCFMPQFEYVYEDYNRELVFRKYANEQADTCGDLLGKITQEGWNCPYYKCVYDVIFAACARPKPFPSTFATLNTLNEEFKCNDKMVDADKSIDSDFKEWLGHTGRSYPDAYNYLIEKKLSNSNAYWKCINELMIRVHPPAPTNWPDSFDYNQEFTDRKCIDYYYGKDAYKNYQNDQEFKKFLPSATKCSELGDFITSRKWVEKRQYWKCIYEVIETKCDQIMAYPPQFQPLNDWRYNHSFEENENNCDFICLSFGDDCLAKDKEWKQFTKTANKPAELYQYIKDHDYDNIENEYNYYFGCIVTTLMNVYPLPPKPFINQFKDINPEYDRRGCFSNKKYGYNFQDYNDELAFRDFAENKDLFCDDLFAYIENLSLSSDYFTCVAEVIEKVCHDIKKFPSQFDQCNNEVINYKCYGIMTDEDRASDSLFKDFAKSVSRYEDLYDYFTTIDTQSKYWACLINMMYHVYPPRPRPFPPKNDTFIALNDYFITQKCINQGYDFDNYVRELKFREYADFAKSCKDLRTYLENQAWSNKYFSCVKNQVIEEVCFKVYPFPPKFEKANQEVIRMNCYSILEEKQNLDEDKPFKTFLATQAQNRDDVYLYFNFNLKRPKHDYWKCIREVMIRTYPPSPPLFDAKWDKFNGFYTQQECINKGYDYEAYLAELNFRAFVSTAKNCKIIRQYISDQKLTSEYFQCVSKVISRGCGAAKPFQSPFGVANDYMVQFSCYDLINQSILEQDNAFKTFTQNQSKWEALYGYLDTNKLGGDYWQCVLLVLQYSWPPRPLDFPTKKFEVLNFFFQESNCIKQYAYDDWKEDAPFKLFVSKAQNCKALGQYIEDKKLSSFSSGYYQCIQNKVIQRCMNVTPYPPQFAPMNPAVEENRCYELMTKDEMVTEDPAWKTFTKSVLKYENLYEKIETFNKDSEYWYCVKDALLHVYPPRPQKFGGVWIELNDEYDNANCIKNYNYNNYLQELEFRKFVKTQKECPPLRQYITQLKLKDAYWQCVDGVVIEKYCFNIIPFPKPYQQCNEVIKTEQCYDTTIYILENRKLDVVFKYFMAQKASGWNDVYDYVDNLINGSTVSDRAKPFWQCIKVVLLKVNPLPPPPFQKPFDILQPEYDKQYCLGKGYNYNDYLAELSFRQFIDTVKDKRRCDKLKAYIVGMSLADTSKYFQCISQVLETVCFAIFPYPPQFEQANVIVPKFGCYNDISYDLIMQDREFKVYAQTTSSYSDLYNYIIKEKQYKDGYWQCVIVALYNVYPPRPDPFPETLCQQNDKNLNSVFQSDGCIDLYRYEDYLYELQFRPIAAKIARGQDLLQVISKNNLSSPYFVCVAGVIQKQCKNQNPFLKPFEAANPAVIKAGCEIFMETDDYKTDAEFKKTLAAYSTWEQVHAYIEKKNYKTDYWVCIKNVIWHVYPPRPIRLPPKFDDIQFTFDSNECLNKGYNYEDWIFERDFRNFAAAQTECKPFREWIKIRNLKNKYWECLDQAIYSVCFAIDQFNAPFLPLNPVVIDTLHCYDDNIMLYNDQLQDKKFKKFASIQSSYDSLNEYITKQGFTSPYWECIKEAIIRVHPPKPEKFAEPFESRNDEIYSLECDKSYKYKDYLENPAFRQYVSTTTSCGDVIKYISKRKLDQTSEYFKCIHMAFNYCDNIQPYPVDYQYIDDEVIRQGCYNKMIKGDREMDAEYKIYSTNVGSIYELQEYVKNKVFQSKYWSCLEKVLLQLAPPKPPQFPPKLGDFNDRYEESQCWLVDYHLSTYKEEVKFREYTKFSSKCSDIQNYLNTRNLISEYWQCVRGFIDATCFNHIPFMGDNEKTYELNVVVDTEQGCYDLMTSDDRTQDQEFKDQAMYMVKGSEYLDFIKSKNYESEYWQCITRAINIVFPPVISWTGKFENLQLKFVEFNCKDAQYSYQDYQNDLQLRDFANSAEKCSDLRRYIDNNRLNSPYFQCLYKVIDQTCFKIIDFPKSFEATNDVIKQQKCYELLEQEEGEYAHDQEFKKFASIAVDYQALHNFITEKKFTGRYWECVTRALLIVYPLPPVKFPTIFEDLNIKFIEFGCLNIKSAYTYKEYKEELAFRELASKQTEKDCVPLRRFIESRQLTGKYWQCVTRVLDQGCFSIVDFSGPYTGLNTWITKYSCYESLKEDDKMKDKEFKNFANNLSNTNEELYTYLSTNNLNSVYFKCVLNALEHWSPPRPPKFEGYFGFLNQHYSSANCYAKSYSYKAFQDELKFRQFAQTTESCEQLITYMKSFKLDGHYWTCVQDVIVKMCFNVKAYPKDFNRMNDAVKYLNCYAKMVPQNYNEDNDFKDFVRWKTAAPEDMRNYIRNEKGYKDAYWNCVYDSVGLAYPSTFQFKTGTFIRLNTFITKCQQKSYTFEDVKKEDAFRTFAATKLNNFQALVDYLWENNYNSRYWNCVGYYIQNQGLYVPNFVEPRFEFLNYESFGQQCLKSAENKPLDTQFKSKARSLAKVQDLYDYVATQSGPYWECETKALQRAYPPPPPPFTGKYESLNAPYKNKKCIDKDYTYAAYELEVKFRKEAESAADCFQLLSLLASSDYQTTYFNCVKDVINAVCVEVRKFPVRFTLMNEQVNKLDCYSKMTGDEKVQDSEFKDYCLTDASEYADLRNYIVGKSLNTAYWLCIKEAVDRIVPPRPPQFNEKFNEINANYDSFQCWTKTYSFEQYQLELKFREAAASFEECKQLREYIKTNKLNGAYFQCVSSAIDKSCPFTFGEKFAGLNEGFNGCQSQLTAVESTTYEQFKNFVNTKAQNYQQVYKYLIEREYTTAFWICIVKVIQSVESIPQATPAYGGVLSGLENEQQACKSEYNFYDYILDIKFRVYQTSNNNCYEFRDFVLKSSQVKVAGASTTPYLRCFKEKMDAVCPPELEFPDRFAAFREQYNSQQCRRYRSPQDLIDDGVFRIYANQDSVQVYQDLFIYLAKKQGVEIFNPLQHFLKKSLKAKLQEYHHDGRTSQTSQPQPSTTLDLSQGYWSCVMICLQNVARPALPGTGTFKNTYFQKYFVSEKCYTQDMTINIEYSFDTFLADIKFRKAIDNPDLTFQGILDQLNKYKVSGRYFKCCAYALVKAKEEFDAIPPPLPPAPVVTNKELYGKYYVDDQCKGATGDCKYFKWTFNNKGYSMRCPRERYESWFQNDKNTGSDFFRFKDWANPFDTDLEVFLPIPDTFNSVGFAQVDGTSSKSYFRIIRCENDQFKTYSGCAGRNKKTTFVVQRFVNDKEVFDCRFVIYKL